MHEIIFYRDSRGREPVLEYLKGLSNQGGKIVELN